MSTVEEIKAKYCADSALLDKLKKMSSVERAKAINQMSGPKFWDLKKVANEIKAKIDKGSASSDELDIIKTMAMFRIKPGEYIYNAKKSR